MKRKSNAELVQRGDPIVSEINLEKLVEMVARRLQHQNAAKPPEEMTTEELSDAVLLQPWFLPKAVSNEIMRLLPISHQQKWVYTFQDWGCWRCERKDVIHQSLGLCLRCYGLVSGRLKSSIVRHANVDGPTLSELVGALTAKSDRARQVFAADHQILSAATGRRNARDPR